MIDLIEIHSEEPQTKFCCVCDTLTYFDVKVWYVDVEGKYSGCILSCCVDKVGKIIDWDYDKI